MAGTFQGGVYTPEPTPQPTQQPPMVRYGAPAEQPAQGNSLMDIYRNILLALSMRKGHPQGGAPYVGGKVINYPEEPVQPTSSISPGA